MKTRFASLLVALALLVPGAVKAEDFTLKVATVAPEAHCLAEGDAPIGKGC